MLHTVIIAVGKRKQPDLYEYMAGLAANTKNLRNVATFYLRNLYTGLGKPEAERHSLEADVIRKVHLGLTRHNDKVLKKRSDYIHSDAYRGMSDKEKKTAYEKFCKQNAIYRLPDETYRSLSSEALTTVLQEIEDADYRSLPGQVNQRAVAKSVSAWKAGWALICKWKTTPSEFAEKPSLPGYIRSIRSTVSLSNQICRIKAEPDGRQYLQFPKTKNRLCLGHMKLRGKLQSVELVPYHERFDVMLTFKTEDCASEKPKVHKRIYALDPGIDNFMTVTGNFQMTPFLMCGRRLKSMNCLYNKRRTAMILEAMKGQKNTKGRRLIITPEIQKLDDQRNRFIRDTFYKMAHYICRKAVNDGVTLIVVGKNKNWKQMSPMHDKENQNFVQLLHARFIRILTCVASQYNICVEEQEESYTSKADFLAGDEIPVCGIKESETVEFSGRRICRGLYRSKNGTIINADVNGSLNILRKHTPDAFKDVKDFSWIWQTVLRVTYEMIQPSACKVSP